MAKQKNKDGYLQIRIDQKIKELFVIACNYTKKSQTEVLTEAIVNFIDEIMEVEE